MIISRTPLRVSFFGGGSDFAEYYKNSKFGYGTTISTAINMYVYITVNKKFDKDIRVCYSENEVVTDVSDIKHNLIREALHLTGIDHGVEIIYTADLPLSSAGVGLASSSAITVGVLNALYAYKGVYVSPETLARQACHIEIDILGNPIGIQDQFAVAHGGFKQYKYFRDDSVSVSPVVCSLDTMKRLKNNLLLFYTGMTRNSSSIMREQNDTIHSKMSLVDHVVTEAEDAFQNLVLGNLDEWGHALDRVWTTKKNFAKGIANVEIDEMYDKAKSSGALGGKILGAGGGGFMLLYVPCEFQESVKKALSGYRLIDFNFEEEGSKIIFSKANVA